MMKEEDPIDKEDREEFMKISSKERRLTDPFNLYGHGIMVYFRLHIRLIKTLVILTFLFALPMMMFYSTMTDGGKGLSSGFFETYSFLSVQRASSTCAQKFVGIA